MIQDNLPPPHMLTESFIKWLLGAKEGEKYCYYFGPHVAGHTVARTVFKEYEKGTVILFQKREGKQFYYWAQKRRRWGMDE